MRRLRVWLLLAAVPGLGFLGAADRKLTAEERIELIRGLTAEYATAKVPIPRSKKPLILESQGTFDEKLWMAIGREEGPAARAGDLVQVTKVSLDDKRILLELNGGAGAGSKWYEHIQIGHGATRTTPIGPGRALPRRRHQPGPGLSGPSSAPGCPGDQEDARAGPGFQPAQRQRAVRGVICPRPSSRPSRRRRPWRAWTGSR